ncbi:hypothetical protein WISP_19577 [Willisornis vidua]|uniref:Uncharacterized protein n=1 Tax=Willisornis vidua TaxID=1566151 RepID=A0ABQ9DUJ9_9PASS|nr:hypothetical protein WISP_19577 [Willisornis vidua]
MCWDSGSSCMLEACWEMVTDENDCKCGAHRFATQEDCFLKRRLLEKEELALQAILGRCYGHRESGEGAHTGVQNGGDMAAAKQTSINNLEMVPADQQHRAAQPQAEAALKPLKKFTCCFAACEHDTYAEA